MLAVSRWELFAQAGCIANYGPNLQELPRPTTLIDAQACTTGDVAVLTGDRRAQAFHSAVERRCRARVHGAGYLLRFG